MLQGAILIRYKDTFGRDGWPWLPGNSAGAGKTQCLFLQGKENCARVIQSIELFTAIVFDCALLTLYFFLKNIGNHFH